MWAGRGPESGREYQMCIQVAELTPYRGISVDSCSAIQLPRAVPCHLFRTYDCHHYCTSSDLLAIVSRDCMHCLRRTDITQRWI